MKNETKDPMAALIGKMMQDMLGDKDMQIIQLRAANAVLQADVKRLQERLMTLTAPELPLHDLPTVGVANGHAH